MSKIETSGGGRSQDRAHVPPAGEQATATTPVTSSIPVTRAVNPRADGTVRLGRSGPASDRTLTRGGRVRKWDREPPPHDWRWYIGNLGKTLIAVGILMFGFVGYQLYGTGIETAAAQSQLKDDFEEQLAVVQPIDRATFEVGDDSGTVDAAPATEPGELADVADDIIAPGAEQPADPSTPADEAAIPPAVPLAAQNIPNDLENGDALFKLEIPSIGVSDIVVAGVATADLKRGPGHFPDTPLPGQLGNAAVAGHRTTYGEPFRNVDKLQNGDEIRVTTLNGVFIYRVTGQAIVEPSQYQVVATTDPTTANLTLTSCHPVWSARQRIVIFSELDRTESAPVGEPIINYGRTEPAAPTLEIPGDQDLPAGDEGNDIAAETTDDAGGAVDPTQPPAEGEATGSLTDDTATHADQLGTDAVNEGIADAFSDGWFSDPGANSQVGLWGLALAAIAIAAYALSRRFRRDLVGLAIGLVPFALALYFFFQNVNRLLPPNL